MRWARLCAIATATCLAGPWPVAFGAENGSPSRVESVPSAAPSEADLFAGALDLVTSASAQEELSGRRRRQPPPVFPLPTQDALELDASARVQEPILEETSDSLRDPLPAIRRRDPRPNDIAAETGPSGVIPAAPMVTPSDASARAERLAASARVLRELAEREGDQTGPMLRANGAPELDSGRYVEEPKLYPAPTPGRNDLRPNDFVADVGSTGVIRAASTVAPPRRKAPARHVESAAASVGWEVPGRGGDSPAPMLRTNDAPERDVRPSAQEEIPHPLPTLPEQDPMADDIVADDIVADIDPDGFMEDCSGQLWGDVWDVCCSYCRGGLIGGVEGTFLAPIGEPSQTVILTDLMTGQAYSGTSDPSLGAGVRAWLGLERNGWGFRVQYWHFGNEEIEADPTVPSDGEPTFDDVFYLNAYTVDIELTQAMCFGAWRIDSSLGGRYARLERNATVVGYGTLGNGVDLYGLAMGANDMDGSGFTFSIAGRKPLCCCCGWHLFWRFRGSLLWTCSCASVLTEANAVTDNPVGAAHSRDMASACTDDSEDVFITEVQWGVQYERCLCCIPATLFFRAALEYQHWNTGDVFAQTNSFAFLQGASPALGGRVDAVSDAHDGDLDLIGFVLGGGLTY